MTDAAALLKDAKARLEERKADEAQELSAQALSIYKKSTDQAGSADSLRVLIAARIEAGNLKLDEALKALRDETLKVKKSAKDGRQAEALLQLATAEVHFKRGEYDKALRLGAEAQGFFEREEDQAHTAESSGGVVVSSHLARSDGPKALAVANEALALAQRMHDVRAEARAWAVVSASRFATGSVDAAEAAQKALALFRELGNKAAEASTLGGLSKGYLSQQAAQDALSAARESLAIATSIADWEQAGTAIQLIVEAQIQAGSPTDALASAEQELSKLDPATGKKAVAGAMEAIVVAHAAAHGADSALQVVKSNIETLREAGNQIGEVRMLHKLTTMSPHPDVALNTAQAALALAQKLGDVREERALKKTLTDLYVAKGRVERAPNRREALNLLADLAKELERKDGDRFEEVNKSLDGFWNALTQSDIESTMQKVISKDPTAYLAFLKVHGANVAGTQQQQSGNSIRPVPVGSLYFAFRVSGLGYGPRFRCCQPAYKKMSEPGAMGVVTLQEASDDWEREIAYSASLLDCALQTGAAMGHNV